MSTRFLRVHASGRYSKSSASLKASLDDYKWRGATIITGTEAYKSHGRAQAAEAWAKANGWGFNVPHKGSGNGFSDDAFILWDLTVWKRVHTARPKVTSRFYFTKAGKKEPGEYAAVEVLRNLHVLHNVEFSVTHTASHVQKGNRWQKNRRVTTWLGQVRGWRRITNSTYRRYHCRGLVTAADWNIDLHRRRWRTLLHVMFPSRHLNWSGRIPKAGTHAGRRLIDADLYRGHLRVKSTRLILHDPVAAKASDHGPYEVEYELS